MKSITSRLNTFLAKVAGRDVDISTLTPPVAINATEELLLEIADRIDSGGSSDFSTAEVTVTDASTYSDGDTCNCPNIYDDEIYGYVDLLDMGGEISAVLYKGKCMLTIPMRYPVMVTNVTGDIEISGRGAIISGPGTITIGDDGGSS